MEYIHRKLESTLLEAYKYFKVLCITGPRQAGKSTLIRHLFGDAVCYSMKDLHVREFAQNDPVAFLHNHKGLVFIDEVQLVPTLFEYIQGIVDLDPSRKFILSGSSNFELMQSLSESLAGRAGVFELLPMSGEEVPQALHSKDMNHLLYDGLYPAICANETIARYFYPSYVKTYLEKDIRSLLKIKDSLLFLKFLRLCAARTGSLFNISELSGEVGVDNKTISAWLSVLVSSYVITLLPPYYSNVSKRLIKSPKLYFTDTGLACHLLDIETPEQLARDKMRGNLFENFVVMETIKHRLNNGREGGVYFYRDSNGNEVDILLKEGGNLRAYEVKSSMTYTKAFEKTLRKVTDWVKEPVVGRTLIYDGDFENTAGDIHVINYRHLHFHNAR